MSNRPSVSIIMLNYNYGRYLAQAVQSVLDQTYQDFEILIADDASTDPSLEILADYVKHHPNRIRILTAPDGKRLGIVKNYARALAAIRGTYTAFLEADDYWHPHNLEEKIGVLQKHPDVGVVFSRCTPFGELLPVLYWKIYAAANQTFLPAQRTFDLFPSFLRRNTVVSFSHFVTRKDLLQNLPAPPQEKNYDWWMLAHLALENSFYFIPKPLSFWRIHRQSAGYNRVNRYTLGRLYQFFTRLYPSLLQTSRDLPEKQAENRRRVLQHASDYLHPAKNQGQRFWIQPLRHPLESLRILSYIFLKNLLFMRKSTSYA